MHHGSSLAAAPASDPELWLPVTIRVAWELAMARVRVREEVLTDVREHVLRCAPEGLPPSELEHLVPGLVADYIQRIKAGRYARTRPPTPPPVPIEPEWVERVLDGLDPLSAAVAQLHYGDGMTMADAGRHLRVREHTLDAARAGLRELVRAVAGLGEARDPDDHDREADQLLRRLAARPRPGCPGPLGLTSDAGLRHADQCPRCSRAARLVRDGVLTPRELFRPTGPMVEPGQVEVLALLLHPDARKHDLALSTALANRAVPAGPDAWLVRGDAVPELIAALAPLCEAGTPARHHLRGALLSGPGRWSRGVLLGPLGVAALEAARARPWADLGGLGALPAPLPPPPSATAWWAGAAIAAALAVTAAIYTLAPRAPNPDTPVEARFSAQPDGWSVRFDTSELATVDVVVLDDGELHLSRRSVKAEKGAWATGDGDYRLEVDGDAMALVSSPEGLPGLEALLMHAGTNAAPLDTFAAAVREMDPRADVALSPPRPPSPSPTQAAYTPPPP